MSKPETSPARLSLAGSLRGVWDRAGMGAILALLLLIVSIAVPNFLSVMNMQGLALAVSMTGMVACTMLFTMAAGHFDLSVGSVVAGAGVLTAVVIQSSGSVALGIGAGLAFGALVGVVNGVIIARFRINALITTLATMQIVRGIAYILSDGKAVSVNDESFFLLGSSDVGNLPLPVIITVLCFAIFGFLLSKTVFGRNSLAIGGSEEAARLAGVPVKRTLVWIFALQGLVAAFAGIVLASRMTSGQPMTSIGFELDVISACVLGGVSLSGGIGTMGGVIVGVLIMGTVQNAMNLLNIPPFYQYLARGVILLAATGLDKLRVKK